MILLTLAGCLFVSDKEFDAWADADGDGVYDHALGGEDCDDADPTVTGGAPLFRDADGDGLGDAATEATRCPGEGWVADAGDCDDDDATVGAAPTRYRDADGDGFGDPAVTSAECAVGGGWVDNADDCDDADGSRTDEGRPFYADTDGDGYGDAEARVEACSAPEGHVDNDEDCDDTDAALHERAVSYADSDGDGYGDATTYQIACSYLDGPWTSDETDCDDTDPEVNPGVHEWGNGEVDHDCDGAYGDSRLENVGVFFIGAYAGAGIGAAAAPVGDIDGDGIGDVAVGMPGAGYTQVRIGSGATSVGEPGDIQAIRLEAARTWWDEGEAEAGAALAAGDFDGDGLTDLVAGAPGGGATSAGTVGVFRARFAAGALTPDARLLGAVPGERFGETIVAGEFNGDRYADLAIASRAPGAVYLVDGPFSGDTPAATAAYTTFELGLDVSAPVPLALGDMDGDGRDDVLVGTPWRDGARVDAGGVYVCTGGAPGTFDATEHCGGELLGDVAGDAFGASVAVADLDGDGNMDLVAGATGVDGAVADVGAAYVFLGGDGRFYDPLQASEADVVLLGEEGAGRTGGRAGATVGVVGDVNGYGGLDLAIGAPDWNDWYEGYGVGAAYIVVGPWSGGGTRSLADAADRFTCIYTDSVTPGGCATGAMVAPAGDLDGDGLADTLVGAPGWLFDEGVTTGAVAVVFGKNVR